MSIPDNCIAGYWSDKDVCRCGVLKRKNIRKRARDYIEKYDIRVAEEEGNVSQLSGGNAQKIIIAREFESHPHLIIACQPTRGVDVGSIEFIPVSYTHLDVYKRQVLSISGNCDAVDSRFHFHPAAV